MKFDPSQFARLVRADQHYPPEANDREGYGPTGAWRAGSEALKLALQCWCAAEEEAAQDIFALANTWLSAPAEQGKPWGTPAIFHEAVHRQAQAAAAWAGGKNDLTAWQLAADAIDLWLKADEPGDREAWVFQSALCRWLAGHKPEAASLSGVQRDLIHELALGTGDASAFAAYLDKTRDRHFETTGGYSHAIIQIAAFGQAGKIEHPPLCLQAFFILAPEMALPPGLEERGWSDASIDLVELQKEHFSALAGLLRLVGVLNREDENDDATNFAQNASGLALEILPQDKEPTRLRISGPGAGRLGGLITDMLENIAG